MMVHSNHGSYYSILIVPTIIIMPLVDDSNIGITACSDMFKKDSLEKGYKCYNILHLLPWYLSVLLRSKLRIEVRGRRCRSPVDLLFYEELEFTVSLKCSSRS